MPIRDDRGFALLFAMLVLVLVAALSEALLIEARQSRRSASAELAIAKAKYLVDGAITMTILTLIDGSDTVHVPLDGSETKLVVGASQVSVRLRSESGKINVNYASEDQLSELFQYAGLGPSEAEELASRVKAWREAKDVANQGGEIQTYRDAMRPYAPSFSRFRSTDELRLVLGMTDATMERIAPLITISSQDGSVDRSVASDQVLEALGANGDALARGELESRQDGRSAAKPRSPTIGEALSIMAEFDAVGLHVLRSAIIEISGDVQRPYEILSWR